MVRTENDGYYPTPKHLADRMAGKIKYCSKVLEPSAGKGDLIEAIERKDRYSHGGKSSNTFAIESDPTLHATLIGKGIKVIDNDFLTFSGPDKFDTIIMNPPFANGEDHLLKAIDIMYRGQIVCLLNAETIRKPRTKTRKLLLRRLEELGATIEYVKDAFTTAERKTKVEVALIDIKINRKVEDDLFSDCQDKAAKVTTTINGKHDVSTGRTVEELVLEYNEVVKIGTDVIVTYFRNYRKVGKYLALNKEVGRYDSDYGDLTAKMQSQLNALLTSVRTDFWRRTLDLNEVRNRMTSKKLKGFEQQLTDRCFMDFTESNIRQFVLNIVGGYEQTLTEAVLDIFDMMTERHSFGEQKYHEKNIHYFNGWKTNKSFKVGKKVIVPIRGGYDGAFTGWGGEWKLSSDSSYVLNDIDKVMAYFDGGNGYLSMSNAIETAFKSGQSSGIKSTYFTTTCHKKGTIHLTFNSEDILRRFNVTACKGKNWLPGDFGSKKFAQLTMDEKAVVSSFEDAMTYNKNVGKPVFRSGMPQIEFK